MAIILVCDDVQTDRELMGSVVQSTGHVPEYAVDGEDAFNKATRIKPALILMDVVMPKENGFSACRKLKKEPSTANIPVVLVTSKSSSTDKFWGERQGADAYVVKPFSPAELAKVIKKFV